MALQRPVHVSQAYMSKSDLNVSGDGGLREATSDEATDVNELARIVYRRRLCAQEVSRETRL